MKKILIFICCFTIISFRIPDNNYKNVTSNKKDIEFYKLVEVQFKDGDLYGNISIPNFLKKIKPMGGSVFHYQYVGEKSAYVITIEKLKSRNTEKLSDKEYIDISNQVFKENMKGDLSEIERILPLSMKNVRVVQFESNLIIHNKYFLKRVSQFQDKRMDNTFLEDVNCINFHFVTVHNKTKYSFNINYYGDDKSISDVIGLFGTIGGSIKFN